MKIMSGEEQEPGATVFSVFASTFTTVYDPIFTHIDLEIDIEARLGAIRVAGLIEARGEPLKNPITGSEHRARIDLPNGFEYRLAEVASGTSQATGKINFEMSFSHAHFAHLHFPGATRVVLKVFDVLGQTVATLADDRFPAGSHTLHWNGLDADGQPLATGVYFYQLRTGERNLTRRLLLLR